MTIRPPLEFDVIRPEVKYYFRFDPESGRVLGCSIQHKDHSIEVPEELAKQIQHRMKRLSDYTVELENNQYIVKTKNAVNNKQHSNIQSDNNVNQVIYEIVKNTKDSCIRFKLDTIHRKWNITIDSELKNTIQNTIKQQSTFRFFTTPQDNTSVLDYIFELDLQQLCANDSIEIEHKSKQIPRLFCRKVYNYSYEVTQ